MKNMNTATKLNQEQNAKKCVYTVDEIRMMLGIGKNEAYRLTHSKNFPAIRIGNRIVIPKEELRKWISVHTKGVQ